MVEFFQDVVEPELWKYCCHSYYCSLRSRPSFGEKLFIDINFDLKYLVVASKVPRPTCKIKQVGRETWLVCWQLEQMKMQDVDEPCVLSIASPNDNVIARFSK